MNDEKIGYKNPPKHFQFRKGTSGNPGGRPKGRRSFYADLAVALAAQSELRPGLTRQQALATMLVEKASAGDFNAIDRLLQQIVSLEKYTSEAESAEDDALAQDIALGAGNNDANNGADDVDR